MFYIFLDIVYPQKETYPEMSNSSHDEEDLKVHSELIWTFNNIHKELLDLFPNGQFLSEVLKTINGQSWKIDFYPNGKESTSSKIDISIKLLEDKEKQRDQVKAQCYYSFQNKENNSNYVGDFKSKEFNLNQIEEDSQFENSLLQESNDSFIFTFGIVEEDHQNEQIQQVEQVAEDFVEEKQAEEKSQAESSNNVAIIENAKLLDDSVDFEKVTIKQLY